MFAKWSEKDYRENWTKVLQDCHKNIYELHPEYKDKLSKANSRAWEDNKSEILKKQNESKTKNHSWNYSKREEEYYKYLVNIYGSENVKRQYTDERYPYRVDFYVVPEDLFIEINAHWGHGGMPYDPKNKDCQDKLSIWVEKANNSDFYRQAINCWTIRDVEKLNCAKRNNLNYKVIY